MIPQPKLKPVPGEKKYELVEDYAILILGYLIRVPAGFRFDGASIPAFAWIFTYTPFHPHVMLAALVHDWLYTNHQVSREDADIIFKMLLLRSGADPGDTQEMYLAVRLAGRFAWRNGPEELKKIMDFKRLCEGREFFEHYRFPVIVSSRLALTT